MEILAVAVVPCGIRKMVDCLREADPEEASTVIANPQERKRILEGLQRKKLITRSNQGVSCVEQYRMAVLLELLRQGRYKGLARIVRQLIPISEGILGPWHFTRHGQVLRELLFFCYGGGTVDDILELANMAGHLFSPEDPEIDVFQEVLPPDLAAEFFPYLSTEVKLFLLLSLLAWRLADFSSSTSVYFDLARDFLATPEAGRVNSAPLLKLLLYQGDCSVVTELINKGNWLQEEERLALQGGLHFLKGCYRDAVDSFSGSLALFKKRNRKRKATLPGMNGFLHILSLLGLGGDEHLNEAHEHARRMIRTRDERRDLLRFLLPVIKQQLGLLENAEEVTDAAAFDLEYFPERFHALECILTFFPLIWLDPESLLPSGKELFGLLFQRALVAKLSWPAALCADMLAAMDEEGRKKYGDLADRLHEKGGTVSPAGMISRRPRHEQALQTLITLFQKQGQAHGRAGGERLVWWIDPDDEGGMVIEPRLQKLAKSGRWTKGRAVALKRLAKGDEDVPWLTEQDRRVCRAIRREVDGYGWGYRQKSWYELDEEQALIALIGHPLVFLRNTTTPAEIVRGEVQLRVKRREQDIALIMEPLPHPWRSRFVVRESETRFVVYSFSPALQQMAKVIGQGLVVPESSRDMVLQVLDVLSGQLTIQSEIGGGTAAREVEADPRLYLQLIPWNQGLKARMLVRPLGPDGPSFPPGRGAPSVLAEIDGARMQAVRDLEGEAHRANGVLEKCPVLSLYDSGTDQWSITDPADCLELLLQLDQVEDLTLEWPKGKSFQVRSECSFDRLRLQMSRGKGDWFKATGRLEVDENLVLDLRSLLESLDTRRGRFIQLEDGSFLALTEAFRRRLEDLQALSTPVGKGVKINGLATLALEELIESVGTLGDDGSWQEHVRRFTPPPPEPVPSTLLADLRSYQVEGFRWLATLAHWQVGGCLADDMGLGKTVQALAVLLTLAEQGPILVVAPLSVMANWQEEILRFAPTFNVLRFGQGNRQEMLDKLKPFDLVLCSYGLLANEADMLQEVAWRAVVLDEAQAIKNRNTKRSRAARALKADFRLITTGTPLENHLGELWTLFEFLNPGLLGGYRRFVEKFGAIGQGEQDREQRDRLRRLIRPFLLRRVKGDVLAELPPRTEITLRVGMSAEERALYESFRRRALEELESGEEEVGHLQVLARIMELRRLCCNPALVLPDDAPAVPSSKLKVFGDIIDDLLANRHKALVFSQFVGHLQLIRDYLDEKGVSCQYLDGQTSAAQRKERIAAFQAGEGDVFLISLKAGGTGLNLTAADYVIHMDPWWNPAVEDQASDRVHRIGQQRPVTVYRLVMEGTIEERIVELHTSKRNLADSLLKGADTSGRMSAEELLQLLRENSKERDIA